MARPIADIVIPFTAGADDDPLGGTTVREALRSVLKQCGDQEIRNDAHHQLYERLRQLFNEIDNTPGFGDDIVDEYVSALEEFWRILDSYEVKNVVERLLNLTNDSKSIEKVHSVVKKLFGRIGLEASDLEGWEELLANTTTEVRGKLEGIVNGASSLGNELQDVNTQLNALVLINAEIKKMDDPKLESELPESTQKAIRRAQLTLETHLLKGHSVPETPVWFIPEADVKYPQRNGVHGSFASVHVGKLRGSTKVVIKVLKSDAANVDVKTALMKEADILFTLGHSNIVRMVGANHACTLPFIVMEHMTNGNMSDYLKRSPENANMRWKLLYEAAKGLEFLHGMNIVHADLKLNNILISDDGTKALIADFGLSIVKNRSKSKSKFMTRLNTSNGEVAYGAVRWRAPEFSEFTPQLVSDVYSFAMCILEAFSGEAPYVSEDDEEKVKKKIKDGELPPRPEGLHDEAWQLIEQMTIRNPEERVSMMEVLPTLEKFAEEELQANVNAANTLKCRNCHKSQPSGDNFCTKCGGRLVDQPQSAGDLLRDVMDTTTSPTSRTQALQRLYRQLQSTPTPCPSDAGHKLLSLTEYPHGWVDTLYAFGCLRIMHSTPSCGVAVPDGEIATARAVVESELTKGVIQSFVGEAAFQTNGKPGQREAAEVIELLVHLDPANKTELRDRIPALAQVLRDSKDDHQLCTAVLSALVALLADEAESKAELRDQAIDRRLLDILKDDLDAYAKTNAAILLAACVETLVNAPDVRVIINALHDGDLKLQEYLLRLLFSIAKWEEGAKLIGTRGDPTILIELIQRGESESLRCAALGVISQLVKHPPNSAVFVDLDGIEALVRYVDDGILSDESLENFRQLFAHCNDLRLRVATNEWIHASCRRWLDEGTSIQKTNAAKLISELAETLEWRMMQTATEKALETSEHDAKIGVEMPPEWFVAKVDAMFRQIGMGISTSVHLGTLRGREVVVKIPTLVDRDFDLAAQYAFCKDVNIQARIRHPYIAQVVGANHVSSRPFIVMEYAPNGNMVEYLKRSPLNMLQRWRLLHQAALALDFLHSKRVVHANLKLKNILVSAHGEALVSDGGLDSIRPKLDTLAPRKAGTLVVRDIRWMAPEQFNSPPQAASDVYSFAICIVEAFLGERPYGDEEEELVKQKIEQNKLPPRPEDLQDEVWKLIQRMTCLDPRKRISMADVVKELKRFADEERAFEMGRPPLCDACGAVWDNGLSKCQHCDKAVVNLFHTLTINSEEALRQTVSSLTEGTPTQREQALAALSEYAHGSSRNQDAIISTRAVPLLLKLLMDESNAVRLGAVATLSAIASMNPSAQNAVAHDNGMELFLNAISQGSDELLERGLMALCILVDSNLVCQDAARAAGAVQLLLYLSCRVDGRLKIGADMALKLLQVHYAEGTTPSCVKLTFVEPPAPDSIDDHNKKLSSLSTESGEATSIPETSELDAILDTSRVISQFVNLGDQEAPLLYWALQNMDLGLVTYLAANGADINFMDEGQPLIHVAVQLRSLKALQCLVTYGADIDATNKAGETALHIAAAKRSVKMVSFLTSRNAKPNIFDKEGRTPLHNCLFWTPLASDYGLEAAYSVAFDLCDHGALWDSLCAQKWQEAQVRAVQSNGANNQVTSGQAGLGACAQHWAGQRSQNAEDGLREIPIEVVNNGGRSVTTYIDKITTTTAEQEIYRRKICVVGHAKFGKTSLAKSIADNSPCRANRDEHQTVDIDRIHMSFLEEDGETAGRRHDVTFWDYAGQPVYQTVQSVFFSKRTLYLLCVDLHEYETKLNETLPRRDKSKMIQRYLSDHVFRWARLVLMRQPDALFATVGTKRDQVQGDEDRIRNDFKYRLKVWAAGVREDAQKGVNTGTILDTTTYEMLEASLNRIQHEDAWLTVSTLKAEDVRLARKAIEKIIIRTAKERSFLMPTEYTQVLSAIHDMQTTVNGMADGERLGNAITISDDLVLELQGASPDHTIDDESCRNILHTLHDLGDILWFEQEIPEALRGYVIIEPTIVIDVVREVVSHNRSEGSTSEASAVCQHGKLDHEQLRQSPLWGVMDEDLLLAFKQLLKEFLLADPAGGTMVWHSHLIVPAFRKSNSSFGLRPLIKQQSSLRQEGLFTNSFVRWDYAVSSEISDTLFNEFAAASYNDKWQVHTGPDCIQVRFRESAPKDYTFQASIERGADLTDTIRLEVAAAESYICWLYLKWFVLKMQYVLQGYPGLKSLCRIFDPQARVPDTGITLDNAREQAAQLHSSILLPDLSWYKPTTSDEINAMLALVKRELDRSISDVKTEPDGLEAVKKLIVTRGECEFPSLWIFKYNTEAGLGEVRILSDVSGICHHDPLEIKIPPGSLAKYESWIKGGVTVLSTVADCFLGVELLKSAMNTAKSAITNRVDHAVQVHGVIEKLYSPGTEKFTSSSRPEEAVQLLRALLRLHDEHFDDQQISALSKLYPFADIVEGKYNWASRDEIKQKGKNALACNPRLFGNQPPSPTVSASTVSTAASTASSTPHMKLHIESATGFSSWKCRKLYCRWKVWDEKRLVASGTTQRRVAGKWTDVFTIEKVASLEQLLNCELHVWIDRPSRNPLNANSVRTLAHAVLKLEDHIQVGKTHADPVRIEDFPLDKETSPRSSITLSITIPAALASSGA